MMKKLVSLLLVIMPAFSALPVSAEEDYIDSGDRTFLSEYVQVLYGEDSVIPMNEVKSVLQTSDRHLWIAGYQGLMRYNGSETRTFEPDDGFPSFKVNILYEDSAGRLWVGTNDSGAAVYENDVFTVYGLADGLPAASVRSIAESSNGTVYLTTTGGIAAISPDGVLTLHPELYDAFSPQIRHIGDNRFVGLLSDGRIVLFDDDKVTKELPAEHFGEAMPYSIFLKSGNLYIGTRGNDVHIADIELSSFKTVTIPLSTHAHFFKDSEERIWVSAVDGAGYFEDDNFTLIDGLIMSNQIECIYEDYEGNFWLGSTRSGLLQLVRGKFTNISFLASLPNYVVNTTAVWNNDLYIGTDSGLVLLQNYTQVENELTELLDTVRIRSIFIDSENRMWICTWGMGVVLVKADGSFDILNEESGIVANRVRCAAEGQNGDIFLGMNGGVSVLRNQQVVKNYTRESGLLNDVILSLSVDSNGLLVAGSDGGGLYIIDGDNIRNYTESDGLAAGVILRAVPDEHGVWISTGNAVCYLDDDGKVRVIDKLELRDDSAFDIKIIGDEIWFLRSKGISICSIKNLLSDEPLVITNLHRRDGLSSPITANSWNALTDDGILYISSSTDVFSINTRSLYQNEIVPVAKIYAIFADGVQVFKEDGEITIGSGTQRLDVHIALLSFASKDGTVSYMLEGFDTEMKTVNRGDVNASFASYTNLGGGKYTFRLLGTNADGLESQEVFLTIYKEYTLIEMPFFLSVLYIAGAGFVALCIWAFVYRKTQVLIRQRQEYKDTAGQIMSVFSTVVDMREEWMQGHSMRVAVYAKRVGQRLGMSESELETLYYSAMLHDIGRAATPEGILNKKGPLTAEEYSIVKEHATISGNLLDNIKIVGDITLGAKYHHERIDGKGYNEGLKGGEIPLMGRIISVCDALDSMLSERPHRRAMSIERVQSELISNAGTQFDERVTAVLFSLISEGEVPLCD
jgi:energy-coupling factor transport system substrate-specific component